MILKYLKFNLDTKSKPIKPKCDYSQCKWLSGGECGNESLENVIFNQSQNYTQNYTQDYIQLFTFEVNFFITVALAEFAALAAIWAFHDTSVSNNCCFIIVGTVDAVLYIASTFNGYSVIRELKSKLMENELYKCTGIKEYNNQIMLFIYATIYLLIILFWPYIWIFSSLLSFLLFVCLLREIGIINFSR